ncbi:hypothetical protein HY991_05395, partial [Candidatus Micrarchaeota archaeon]|nr:hypothetical protein [Candidatus Micrarchaeota archaeon]
MNLSICGHEFLDFMRGFFSFLLVLLLFPALLEVASIKQSYYAESVFLKRHLLLLEKKYYADLGFKESLHQVFYHSEGDSREEKVNDAAAKLAEWEEFVETSEKEGVFVEAWFGTA